jgi:hypothetical protein
MRVRVTRSVDACIDGIQLGDLIVGRVYELSVPLACYLMAVEAVEPAPDDSAVWVNSAASAAERPSRALSRNTRGGEHGSSGRRRKSR